MNVQLGCQMRFETSERSERKNWVKETLLKAGYRILSFEGFTIYQGRVSLLLDRACFDGEERIWSEDEICRELKTRLSDSYALKARFSEMLGTPWYFVAYTYNSQKITNRIYVFQLSRDTSSLRETFPTAQRFGEWLAQFRSLQMTSGYQETGLPCFDRELRKCQHPWPGNLDGVLVCPSGGILCVLEFQTTLAVSVRAHCNNQWFLPSANRKGDEQRWKVVDILRKQARLPLMILVWSPNEQEIKVKIVKEIVYSDDPDGRKPGLYYTYKEVMEKSRLLQILQNWCGRVPRETESALS